MFVGLLNFSDCEPLKARTLWPKFRRVCRRGLATADLDYQLVSNLFSMNISMGSNFHSNREHQLNQMDSIQRVSDQISQASDFQSSISEFDFRIEFQATSPRFSKSSGHLSQVREKQKFFGYTW